MEVKPAYKQIEVGVLPKDWTVKTLDSIAFVTSGKRLPLGNSLTEHETPHPYVRVTDMRPGTVALEDIMYVPVDVFPAIRHYRIFKDDIFISVAGTLGVVGKIPLELDGANLTENADRITNISCSQNYLLHVLMSSPIQTKIDLSQTVGAQPKLALGRIRKFDIPLPPTLAEQEAIAEALSDADAFIESLEQLLTKKRQIKQGAIQELLTGKKRLPGFSGEWKMKRLGDECNLITKGTTPTSLGRNFISQGINFVKVESLTGDGAILPGMLAAIDEETHHLLTRSQLRQDDILFSIAGALGRTAIIESSLLPANTNQALAIIRLKPQSCLHRSFILRYLSGPQILTHITAINVQAAQANLSLEDIRSFEVPAPSAAEQSAIATILSDIDTEIVALEAKLSKARQLKQGMMQELLTGRIRLI